MSFDCDADGDDDVVVVGPTIPNVLAYRNQGGGLGEVIATPTNFAGQFVALDVRELAPGVPHVHALWAVSGRSVYLALDPISPCGFQDLGNGSQFVGTAVDVAMANLNNSGAPDTVKLFDPNDSGDPSTPFLSVARELDETNQGIVAADDYNMADPRAVAAGNLFGDASDEVLVAAEPNDELLVLEWDGTSLISSFTNVGGQLGGGLRDVRILDFDADADPDVFVLNGATGTVSILRNIGGGAFAAQVPEPSLGASDPQKLSLGDVDGDGDVDVVATNGGTPGSFSVLLNDGTGKFTLAPGSPFDLGDSPGAVALIDLNGDGLLDVVTTTSFVDPVTMQSQLYIALSNP